MNTNSKRTRIYLILMLVAAAASAALRSAAYLFNFDYNDGYFTSKLFINAANIIAVGAVILMSTYLLTAAKVSLRPSFSTPATYVPTGLAGIATVFLGARALSFAASTVSNGFYKLNIFESLKTPNGKISDPTAVIALALSVLAILSIVHYFFNVYLTSARTEIRSYFAISTIVFLATYSILIYFDKTVATSSSAKTVNQLAFIFAALFFIYDTRISLGREMWRSYVTFGLIGCMLTAYSSIPALVVYYAKGELISQVNEYSVASIEQYVLLLALFIYMLSRVILTISLKENKENKTIAAMTEYAQMRSARVEESFARHQEEFASKQLSIFELFGGEAEEIEASEPKKEDDAEEASEEVREITISDDAIYESIFGHMPEKEDGSESCNGTADAEAEEQRDPEEIATELLKIADETDLKRKI